MGPQFHAEAPRDFQPQAKVCGQFLPALYGPADAVSHRHVKLSAKLGTVLGSGVIRYLAIYARRQYYTHKTKAKWFETMKARNKEQILKGAAKIQ